MTELLATYGEALAAAGVMCCLIGLIFQIRSQHRRLDAQTQHLEDLQGAVAAYGQSLIASRALLEQMEARIGAFTEHNLEIQSQLAFHRSFEEASRQIKDGTTIESLVNDCGLSDAEAALMIRLHQREGEKTRQQWRQPSVTALQDEPASPLQVEAQIAPAADESPLTSEEIRLKESLAAAQSR